MILDCGSTTLDLGRPLVMGVLNVTPDSFSDGGRYMAPQVAVAHAEQMIAEGADLIDVGGESTRPGAALVSADEELRRVIPVVQALAQKKSVPISVDTSKPEVIRAAVDAGAVLINDIRALRLPGALEAAVASGAAVCLMHMQGEPDDMQKHPQYGDVIAEVRDFLQERIRACTEAGMTSSRLLIDPGIGFGKAPQHNLTLLAHLHRLGELRLPVLVGVSRKSIIGALTGRAVEQRLPGGLALATAAVLAGVRIIRTHDVAATLDAVKVASALLAAGYPAPGIIRVLDDAQL